METYELSENADKGAEADEYTCKRKADGENDDDVSNSKKIAPSGEEKKATFLRKNIRDVIDENKLDSITLAAQREESERLARVNEQHKLIREHQRQTAVIRQNARTQSKVLTLLQSGNAFAKLTEVTSSFANDGESTDETDDLKEEDVEESKIQINSDEPETQESCEIVTIDDSSDDDCILLSDDEPEVSLEEEEDASNSGMHVKDSYNVPDEQGRVVVNVGHPDTEEDIYVAPQIARFIKPHQIGGVRFLFDNIIESIERFKTSTGFGCILAHSMGLGKTLQVVCFCDLFLRHTDSRTILCVMPINTIQNWLSEFNMWTPRFSDNENNVRPRTFEVFALNDQQKTLSARAKVIKKWSEEGGVLLIGYELFRLLALKLPSKRRKGNKDLEKDDILNTSSNTKNLYADIQKALVKPGPDLVICDEGHRIKNSNAGISLALKQIKTRRRIVLTGYPLQNNLLEYWCMVDFVRPNYLGTRTEFCNMFERPIQNGQCIDSTPSDIKLMRYRAHVLHSLLVGFVQRRSHVVLTETLPEKHEFIILTKMSKFQRNLYKSFMTNVVLTRVCPNPLKAFAVCCKIWNHPDVLYNFLKKRQADLDLEIDDVALENATTSIPEKPDDPDLFSSKSNISSSLDSSNSDLVKKPISEAKRPYMHANYNIQQQQPYPGTENDYWNYSESYDPCRTAQYTPNYVGTVKESNVVQKIEDQTNSSQIVDLDTQEIKTVSAYVKPQFEEPRKDKIKTASNSVEHLTKVKGKSIDTEKLKVESIEEKDEARLKNVEESVPYDWATELMVNYTPGLIENSPKMEIVFYILKESIEVGDRVLLFSQSLLTLNLIEQFLQLNNIPTSTDYWSKGSSYFRLDGSTSAQERERLVNEFNSNINVKLFLISTRAGSLGINLIGANRVIIFDASWNPCHDTQAVYRVYRFGQKKACFIYRIVMDRCLEKKIYDRQIKKQGMSNRVVDECNPESHLSIKDVSNLCHTNESDLDDDKDDTFTQQNEHYEDHILLNIVKLYKNLLSKEPFRHESLLLDRKERKLSQAEKRLAHRGYEAEKKCISQKISINNIQYRMGRSDSTYIAKPSNIATRPVKNMKTTLRSSRWIPADVWQRQGMTAQEMTLPLDVVIPTNSSDKTNIILKAGQRVMVLKSTKGIYMQLESGKIIAIRTSSANKTSENSAANPEKKIIKNEIIDITADGDGSDETDKCDEESDENKNNDNNSKTLEEENNATSIVNIESFPKTDNKETIKKVEISEDSMQFSSTKKWSQDSQVFSQVNELSTTSSGAVYNKDFCGSTTDNTSEKTCSTDIYATNREDTSKQDIVVDNSKSMLNKSTDYLHSSEAGRLCAAVAVAPNPNPENLDMNISSQIHRKNLNDSLESTNYSMNSNSSSLESFSNRGGTTLKNFEHSMPNKGASGNFFHTSMYDSHMNAQRYNYNPEQNASQSYIPTMNVSNNTNSFMPATNLDNYSMNYYDNYNSNGGYIEPNNIRHHRPYTDYQNYQAYSNVPYPNYHNITNGHCTSPSSSDFKSYNYPWPHVNLPIPPSSNICSTNINNSNYSNVPDTNCWPN